MKNEIQLINDGDGLALIGDPTAIDHFLATEGLESKELGLARLGPAFNVASGIAQAGSGIAENAGRWVKLTEKSAKALHKYTPMKGSSTEVHRAVMMENGKIKELLEFVASGPGTMLTNPAILTGAAGLMAQLAMQQTMDEIIGYLATIDEKVADVLRAQSDAVHAEMIGVGFVIDEAITVRGEVGRVSEVTWSKVQSAAVVIAGTQGYALQALDALAEKMEKKTKVSELAKAANEAEAKAQEWLAVLARCFQLQDALAVLELDRVLDSSPDELDRHRLGLRMARQNRLDSIGRTTEQLLERINVAASWANSKVLLHPTASRGVVISSNQVTSSVHSFHQLLGIEQGSESLAIRRWRDAAADVRDKVRDTGAEVRDKVIDTGVEGFETTKRLGDEAVDRAKMATKRLSHGLTERTLRRSGPKPEEQTDDRMVSND